MCQAPFEWIKSADSPGTIHVSTCGNDAGDSLRSTITLVGREDVRVGDTVVPAIRYHLDAEMKGKATGWAKADGIVHATTGLLLHEERTVDTDARAAFGDVHYSEHATFTLLSLTPAR